MEIQRRILGIDYGTKRIGVSVCDPFRLFARAVKVINNTQGLYNELHAVIREFDVEKIVVGIPVRMSGEKSAMTYEVEAFVKKLQEIFSGEIILEDERMSSKQAQQVIRDAGTKKKKRQDKGTVDKVAAVLILQAYLDDLPQ
mgnify:CR=1 FL=1